MKTEGRIEIEIRTENEEKNTRTVKRKGKTITWQKLTETVKREKLARLEKQIFSGNSALSHQRLFKGREIKSSV